MCLKTSDQEHVFAFFKVKLFLDFPFVCAFVKFMVDVPRNSCCK